MSQDSEKFLYFNVGLLQNSFALDALRQDALKHHMIDQPGQLIALRLTEYYELKAKTATRHKSAREEMSVAGFSLINGRNGMIDQNGDDHPDSESIIATSPDAEQNAEAAADYWETL